MKIFAKSVAVYLSILVLLILAINKTKGIVSPSVKDKEQCIEYASRNHEKEFSSSRWKYLQEFGNPNDVEFFYQSCIGHITGIPASKTYMQ